MVQTEPTVTEEGAHRKTKPIAMGLTIARELTLQPPPLQPVHLRAGLHCDGL